MLFILNFFYHDIYIKLLITETVIILSTQLKVLAGVPQRKYQYWISILFRSVRGQDMSTDVLNLTAVKL